jgi:hypothetical protein
MTAGDEEIDVVPGGDAKQLAIDVAAFATSAIPYIGGPISNVISGVGTVRRLGRVRQVVEQLAQELAGFRSEITEKYVKTEEFEELLERTLRQASDERSDEKRRMYAAFLADDLKAPEPSYDQKLRFLRILEEVQLDHLIVLRALAAEPDADPGMMGSPSQTLSKRLPEMTEVHITALVFQLNAIGVTNLQSLKVLMTGRGAADLRHSITAYGHRFLKYLHEA